MGPPRAAASVFARQEVVIERRSPDPAGTRPGGPLSPRIRPATDADARAVADLFLASWKATLVDVPLAHTEDEVRGWVAGVLKRRLGPPIRLYTFPSNPGARRFYERHGFTALAFGDGSGNEEGCPDILYEWRNAPS